jgi:hypothetical protein
MIALIAQRSSGEHFLPPLIPINEPPPYSGFYAVLARLSQIWRRGRDEPRQNRGFAKQWTNSVTTPGKRVR